MRPLPAAELLGAWEDCVALPPVQRALRLLTVATPATSVDELSRLSVGQRDRRLLRLRSSAFGDRMIARVDCPECGKELELDFSVTDVMTDRSDATEEEGESPGEVTFLKLTAGDFEAEFRLPDSRDLLEIARHESTVDTGKRLLLRRCVSVATRAGRKIDIERMPEEIVEEIVARMAREDPQADVRLDLRCPDCSHHWQPGFDIVSFVWAEVDSWARRLLADVHSLAGAYGWSEDEILRLSRSRRQAYLELVRA